MRDRDYSWEDQDPDEIQESLEFGGPDDDDFEDDSQFDEPDGDEDEEDEDRSSSKPSYNDEWSEMARDEALYESERVRFEQENFESLWEEYIDSSENLWGRIDNQDENISYPNLKPEKTAESEPAEPRSWTIQEDKLLMSLYTSHVVWSEIEETLERSKDVLINRISRIAFPVREQQLPGDIPNPKRTAWTQPEDDQIVLAYSRDESLLAAANQLNRTLNSVYLRLSRLGVAKVATLDHMVYHKPLSNRTALKQNQPWTKQDEEELIEAFEKGASFEDILELTQRTPMGVVQNLYKNGKIHDDALARLLEIARGV